MTSADAGTPESQVIISLRKAAGREVRNYAKDKDLESFGLDGH